ncbi:MAG: AAA family ATPase [Patescibacteria group bacterium]|nr:AAA family ATPase [Patescibacteria group bacterium]MDD5294501.1 AAA family ATPase [Patescibacteria group bacterium]MDD5555006.1 AAA family ATPase [Patescibacteria group bacterium]
MPNKKIIIGLVGKISCGKGTVAEYLVNKYGAIAYRFSTPLRDVLNRLYLEITRENMQNISKVLRQGFGDDLLAKVIAGDVRNETNNLIVIDGIRRLSDIKYLKDLPEFKLVKVETEPKIRYERLTSRTENADDSKKIYEQFLADEQQETELTIPEVMSQAQFTLTNDSTLEKLQQQIDNLIKNLE